MKAVIVADLRDPAGGGGRIGDCAYLREVASTRLFDERVFARLEAGNRDRRKLACEVAMTTASRSAASTAARKSVDERAPQRSATSTARSFERSTASVVRWPSPAMAAARLWPIRPHPTMANRMSPVQTQITLFRHDPAQCEDVLVG